MLSTSKTNRGFVLSEFKDRFKSECSIQESSLMCDDDEIGAIWLGVMVDFNGLGCTRMHLTVPMVRDLLPLLQHFAETGRLPEPESTTKGGE